MKTQFPGKVETNAKTLSFEPAAVTSKCAMISVHTIIS